MVVDSQIRSFVSPKTIHQTKNCNIFVEKISENKILKWTSFFGWDDTKKL